MVICPTGSTLCGRTNVSLEYDSWDDHGTALVEKKTGWLTNSPELAEVLDVQCANLRDDKKLWHRHVHLVNGRAKVAEQYPPALVRAILRTLRKILLRRGQISAAELMHGGPTAEMPEVWQDPEYVQYYDDVTGGIHQRKVLGKLVSLRWTGFLRRSFANMFLERKLLIKGSSPYHSYGLISTRAMKRMLIHGLG